MTARTPTAAMSALAEAAEVARMAPSVHNTQPWLWRVGPAALSLRAVRDRQLPVADPDGRLLTVSCGAALHHARLSLSAAGWRYTVDRLPDPSDPDLLARVTVDGQTEPDAEAVGLLRAVQTRRTDRRPVTEEPVPSGVLDAIERAVAAEGADWQVLRPDQVIELAVSMSRADAVEVQDVQHRAEIARWVGGDRPEGTGIPSGVLPDQPPRTQVAGRYFGPPGTLPVGDGHDVAATYALLHGGSDTPQGWLRAGEALDAGWLVAVEHGVSVLPISAVVEVLGVRQLLREMLAELSYPYLALRLGRPNTEQPGPPDTPRLPARSVVERVTGDSGGGGSGPARRS